MQMKNPFYSPSTNKDVIFAIVSCRKDGGLIVLGTADGQTMPLVTMDEQLVPILMEHASSILKPRNEEFELRKYTVSEIIKG